MTRRVLTALGIAAGLMLAALVAGAAVHPPLDARPRHVLLPAGPHDLADLSLRARSGRLVMRPWIRPLATRRRMRLLSSTVHTHTSMLFCSQKLSASLVTYC